MSLIHEALEKLEQEKQGSPLSLPEMREGQETTSVPDKEKGGRGKNARAISWGGAALLIFLIGWGLGYLFLSSLGARPKPADSSRPVTPASSGAPRPASSSPVPAERFSLTGITRVGGDFTAIINNQLVRAGDWVNGAQVRSIEDREVTLDFSGQVVTLKLY